MTRDTARKVTDLLLRHSREQDDMLQEIKDTCNEKEFNVIRSMIARTMGSMYLDCIQPVFAEHPDLKPAGFP